MPEPGFTKYKYGMFMHHRTFKRQVRANVSYFENSFLIIDDVFDLTSSDVALLNTLEKLKVCVTVINIRPNCIPRVVALCRREPVSKNMVHEESIPFVTKEMQAVRQALLDSRPDFPESVIDHVVLPYSRREALCYM